MRNDLTNNMKMINFRSDLPVTSIAPVYDYSILENNIGDKVNMYEILAHMEDRYKHLKNTLTDEYDKKSENIRYLIMNKDILNKKYMINLIDNIRENVDFYCKHLRLQKPPRMWIQLWCNFLLNDEKIDIHQHAFDKFSFLSVSKAICASDDPVSFS